MPSPMPACAAGSRPGEVALVDLTGHIGIRPRAIEFAKGGRLEALEWSRWDDRGAGGDGPYGRRGVRAGLRPRHEDRGARDDRLVARRSCARPGGSSTAGGSRRPSDDPDAQSTSWLAAPC